MGFLDKLKQAIMGTKDLADDTKDALLGPTELWTIQQIVPKERPMIQQIERKEQTDNVAEKVKRAGNESERAVDNSAEKVKRVGDKAENAVDDADAASDELKKD